MFLGPSIGWDPFWDPYPAYSYAPPVVTDPAPQAYVQQPQAPGYWYYCTEAAAVPGMAHGIPLHIGLAAGRPQGQSWVHTAPPHPNGQKYGSRAMTTGDRRATL